MQPKQTSRAQDARTILKKDHDKVKTLFSKFERSKNKEQQGAYAHEAIQSLKIHATVEEELFYPALRQTLPLPQRGIMDEADEEHHVAKVLIAELELMSGQEEEYAAKFKVLAESVRHHIEEEEKQMFRLAGRTDVDFAALGAQLMERMQALQAEGVPPDTEMEMVKAAGPRRESQARQNEKRYQAPRVETSRAKRHGRKG